MTRCICPSARSAFMGNEPSTPKVTHSFISNFANLPASAQPSSATNSPDRAYQQPATCTPCMHRCVVLFVAADDDVVIDGSRSPVIGNVQRRRGTFSRRSSRWQPLCPTTYRRFSSTTVQRMHTPTTAANRRHTTIEQATAATVR